MVWLLLFFLPAARAQSSDLRFHRRLPDVLQDALVYERVVVTPYTFATTFVPALLSFYVMAILVQLPHTRLYRLSFLPIVFWMTLRANMTMDFSFNHPGYAYFNQGLALSMFTIAMRSTTWALATRRYTRIPASRPMNGAANDHTSTKLSVSVYSTMWNAWDLTANLRCIGWDGPQKIPVPTPYLQVESRLVFILLSLGRFVFWFLIFDALSAYIHFLGPGTFGTSNGGTIFDLSLAPLERYIKSSFITFLSSTSAYIMIEVVYQLHATLFTILFWQLPSQWPPLFDSPWLSTSLSSLWGRQWHQLFRESFMALGGKLTGKYFGQVGTILGVFTISGALHDIGIRGMGRGSDTFLVVGFFLMQGVGIIMEQAWKRSTRMRVSGFVGWAWMCFWLLLWGQFVVDLWARTGLLGSEFLPEAYRPTLLLLNWIFG